MDREKIYFEFVDQPNREIDKCCGNCKWHKYEEESGSWVCCNADSEYVADFTNCSFGCYEWEGK